MHDPDVVVFDIHLPIPVRRWKAMGAESNGFRRRRRTNPENLGEPVYPWYRPEGWELVIARRRIGMFKLAVIWHGEPEGRDSGTVCKGMLGTDLNWHNVKWAWKHRHHLSVQVLPYQRIRQWLFTRCAECGHRFFWKQARFGYMGGDKTYHEKCMSLRHTQGQLEDAAKAITFTATDTERWRVERWLAWREEQAQKVTQ